MSEPTNTDQPAEASDRDVYTAAAEAARTNGQDAFAAAFERMAGPAPEGDSQPTEQPEHG